MNAFASHFILRELPVLLRGEPQTISIFIVVILQMTTALRPIVGKADTLLPIEKKFFVSHWMECLK